MDIIRGLAHPLIAAPFIVDGFGAAINPDPHAEQVLRASASLAKLGVNPPSLEQARLASRATGAASAVCGLYFIVGKHKRIAATLLAINALALGAVNCPTHVDKSLPKSERRLKKKLQKRKLVEYGAAFGGLLLATVDRAGAPSWRWARSFHKEERELLAAAEEKAFLAGQKAGEKVAAKAARAAKKQA